MSKPGRSYMCWAAALLPCIVDEGSQEKVVKLPVVMYSDRYVQQFHALLPAMIYLYCTEKHRNLVMMPLDLHICNKNTSVLFKHLINILMEVKKRHQGWLNVSILNFTYDWDNHRFRIIAAILDFFLAQETAGSNLLTPMSQYASFHNALLYSLENLKAKRDLDLLGTC